MLSGQPEGKRNRKQDFKKGNIYIYIQYGEMTLYRIIIIHQYVYVRKDPGQTPESLTSLTR